MSIYSVSYNLNNSYGAYVQRLTPATRSRLIALHIPFNENISESEAQALINAALAKKEAQDTQEENQPVIKRNNGNDILERAKNLARRLGIEFDETIDIEQLLTKIEATLRSKIQANQNNVNMLRQLKDFSDELLSLQSQCNGSMGYDNKNQALLMSLEILSQYNKNFLNQ